MESKIISKQICFLIAMAFILNISGQSKELTVKQKAKLYPIKDVVSRYHNNWTQDHYKSRIKDFKKAPLKFNEIVFIGNSITEQGGNWTQKFDIPNIRNRGIAGDVSHGVIKRLNEIIYFKPKAVFILIGVNDLYNIHHEEAGGNLKYDKIIPSPAHIGKNILKITKRIHRKSPETKIFVRTVLPTRRKYLKQDTLSLNKIIKNNETKGYYKVLDWYSEFVDTSGELREDLTVDGVHLSVKGYEKWVNLEKSIIEKL